MRKDLYTNGSVDLPKITKKRSFFDLSHSSHIDMNVGSLYPIDQVLPVMPGDTFDYSHRLNIRMTNPPKFPTMDQLVFDLYFFYVPNRIVWTNFDNFITNRASNFYADFSYYYPIIDICTSSFGSSYAALEGSVLDYLGFGALTFKGSNIGGAYNPSALPVRGYYKIWNEFFRYEPLQSEILVDTSDSPHFGGLGVNDISGVNTYYLVNTNQAASYNTMMAKALYGLALAPVNRLPGYFSRALPQPLAGSDVKILEDIQIGGDTIGGFVSRPLFGFDDPISASSNLINSSAGAESTMKAGGEYLNYIKGSVASSESNSIRALANAFALNKFLYIDNVFGKRITEWTYGHFGVNVPDSRVQRPEFLGKRRIYININQIMQSSETTSTSPQGNAGAWSQTFDSHHDFTKSFVEFGYLHSVGCIRVLNHSYAQGIDKHWTYRTRFDYPLPEFQNAGDQEVKGYEIYPDIVNPDYTWGYQERYAECKMIPSRVAGHMRPQSTNTLSVWTYTDYYTSKPTLSATWMIEPTANFERTIYFNQSTAPSFILDYVADLKAYRSLQYHSIPGGLTGSW